MRLHENIDFTTLTWVKPELDETLRQARQALEAYVEDGEDPGQLRSCATYLHQVSGTLRMVELYGAAMVAEEMEQLARALVEGQVAERDSGYAALMRGIVQLPDYLERLQSGHRDIPIVLLPLLNELREPRGEKGLSEAVLFSPDLSRPLPASAAGPKASLPPEEVKRRAEMLRSLFQSALLRWLKDDDSAATVRDLTDVCEQLVPITDSEHARRLFWVAAGTLDALAKHAFEPDKSLKQAIAKLEREIKRLAEGGDAAFRSDPPLELTRQLLYFVAHAPTEGGRIGEIRQVFGLGEYLPSEQELAHARGSLSGRNRALLSTVAAAIKEDLLRVKDALDLHMRTPDAPSLALSDQVEALDRVADTLGMLGLGVPRRVVQDQRSAIQAIVGGQRAADESNLLDIAGALLYVEASLDDQVARLGEADAPAPAGEAAAPAPDGSMLPGSEARKVLEVLVKEAIGNFAQARQCFVAFVETHWDHAQLADVPRLLEEVAGALRILELEDAPRYLAAIRRFSEIELVRRQRVPNGQQMDRLADVLAGLEYYLEALRDRRPKRDQILDTVRQNLEALGYWPLPAEDLEAMAPAQKVSAPAPAPAAPPPVADIAPGPMPEPAPAPTPEPAPEPFTAAEPAPEPAPAAAAPATAPAPAPAPAEAPFVPVFQIEPLAPPAAPVETATAVPEAAPEVPLELPTEPEVAEAPAAVETAPEPAVEERGVEAPAPAAAAAFPVVGGFDGSSDEIDDEIREVFLEEFQEEIANLEQLLPTWRSQPDNVEQLRPIRRVFHTLKGSGRLVGARTLGEFSWKIESMLNRVLDGTRPASPAVVALVQRAYDTLPLLRDALGGATVHADLAGIEAIADRVAAGEDAFYSEPAAAPFAVEAAPAPEPVVEAAAAAPVADIAPPAPEPEPVVEATRETESAPAPAAETPAGDIAEAGFVIDPVLFEILKPEVAGHLETVDAWLAACAAGGPQPISDPLLRSVHTMNGAFAMTEVTALTEVTAPLEGFMKRSLANQRTPDVDGVQLVAESAAAIRAVIAALEDPRRGLPDYSELAGRAERARDSLPEAAGSLAMPTPDEITEVLPTPVPMPPPDTSELPVFDTATADDEAPAEMPTEAQERISLDAFLVDAIPSDAAAFTVVEAADEHAPALSLSDGYDPVAEAIAAEA
ncbi:Hpt domain-containing protein, partial [Arenimonas composti]